MVSCAHKWEQVLHNGEEASIRVNAQASISTSQDVASSSSSDLAAKPSAKMARKPKPKLKPKPNPRLDRGKPEPPATASMAPINHHFAPLPELPPLSAGFMLPPDVFALFYQGQVQKETSAKQPRLIGALPPPTKRSGWCNSTWAPCLCGMATTLVYQIQDRWLIRNRGGFWRPCTNMSYSQPGSY